MSDTIRGFARDVARFADDWPASGAELVDRAIVDRLRAENDELRGIASNAMAEAERRPPRRDLVPLHQAIALFGQNSKPLGG